MALIRGGFPQLDRTKIPKEWMDQNGWISEKWNLINELKKIPKDTHRLINEILFFVEKKEKSKSIFPMQG
jgi:hypothetical protein